VYNAGSILVTGRRGLLIIVRSQPVQKYKNLIYFEFNINNKNELFVQINKLILSTLYNYSILKYLQYVYEQIILEYLLSEIASIQNNYKIINKIRKFPKANKL